MESSAVIKALGALAHTSRLAVFRWLVQAGPQGGHPGEIAGQLGLAPATLSFHLKSLAQAGLVRSSQSGRHIRYTADYGAMRALIDYLTENCCAGRPELCAPAARCAP